MTAEILLSVVIMQYSDTSNLTGIIEDITFLLGLDTNAFSLKDRTRCVNERYRMVWQMIFESYGGWQFMDDNVSDASTGIPYADSNITSGTGLYTLPSAALTVKGVEIKNTGGNWERLTPITFEEFQAMGADSTFTTNSSPTYYMLQGDVIRILPVPNYTQSSSLRVFFDQDISTFAYTDTTKVPGFASHLHRILSIGAALDYAMTHPGLEQKVASLGLLWAEYSRNIRSFYAQRFQDKSPGRVRSTDLLNEFS